jgi:hypothetical protein
MRTTVCLAMLLCLWGTVGAIAQSEKEPRPVSGALLAGFLKIDIPGYARQGVPDETPVQVDARRLSQATATFTRGEAYLEIQILDGALVPAAYADFEALRSGPAEAGDETVRRIMVKGWPGVERYTADDRTAEVLVLVSGRFLVGLENEDVPNASETAGIAELIDLQGLAALARR